MIKKLATAIAVIIVLLLILSCATAELPSTPTFTEPEIPVNYTTYTDELQLFRISYPSEWEIPPASLADIKQAASDYLKSVDSDLPLEKATYLFVVGKQAMGGYNPNVSIAVESLPQGVLTHEQMVEATLRGIITSVEDYMLVSRSKTTVGDREATIVDLEVTLSGKGRYHVLQMYILVNKTAWLVSCITTPEDFIKWEKDFQSIVRSLRILK